MHERSKINAKGSVRFTQPLEAPGRQPAEPAEVGFGRLAPPPSEVSDLSRLPSVPEAVAGSSQPSAMSIDSSRKLQAAERQISELRSEVEAGKTSRGELKRDLQEATASLRAATREAGETDQTRILRQEITEIRRDMRDERGRAAPAGPAPSGPVVTVSAPGGGGAAGGGSSSSSGGGSGAAGSGGRGTDLSGIVEAVKALAEKVGEKEKKPAGPGARKGITQARRRYTDVRKTKLAEMRALKSKRIREFNAKTKQMPKAQRDKARRAFKAKVEAQFREISKKFPTARGMKTVGVVRQLIAKMQKIRLPRA